MENLLMVLSWGLFYSLHTALAASKLKRILKAKWPGPYNWYRLFYSIFSSVIFLGIVIQALFLPIHHLFLPNQFSQYSGYMIATAGVIIFLKSIKEISIPSFLGLIPEDQKTVGSELVVTGLYSQVRHPLYLGMFFIFFGYFLVSGTLGSFIHFACLVGYLPFGIFFEEKNLIATFGDSYKSYQKDVPAFIPRIHKKRA